MPQTTDLPLMLRMTADILELALSPKSVYPKPVCCEPFLALPVTLLCFIVAQRCVLDPRQPVNMSPRRMVPCARVCCCAAQADIARFDRRLPATVLHFLLAIGKALETIGERRIFPDLLGRSVFQLTVKHLAVNNDRLPVRRCRCDIIVCIWL